MAGGDEDAEKLGGIGVDRREMTAGITIEATGGQFDRFSESFGEHFFFEAAHLPIIRCVGEDRKRTGFQSNDRPIVGLAGRILSAL